MKSSSKRPKYNCTKIAIGTKFNRWTVIGEPKKPRKKTHYCMCKCDCGTERIVRVSGLVAGESVSCGCYRREQNIKAVVKHGKYKSREYHIWGAMRARCRNKKSASYKRYGGRGIAICERWNVFDNFYDDMGAAPPGSSIDRIDNNGNYEPQNCRWATNHEQARNKNTNRFFVVNNERRCLKDLALNHGVSYKRLLYRVNNGASIADAIAAAGTPRWSKRLQKNKNP